MEYEERKDAEEAMSKFNGHEVEGRTLKLDWDVGINRKRTGEASDSGSRDVATAAKVDDAPSW